MAEHAQRIDAEVREAAEVTAALNAEAASREAVVARGRASDATRRTLDQITAAEARLVAQRQAAEAERQAQHADSITLAEAVSAPSTEPGQTTERRRPWWSEFSLHRTEPTEPEGTGPRTVTSLSAAERETTVTVSDADDLVRVWSCRRRDIGRMRRHPAFTETASGFYGTTEWASFTIPADSWSPATGAKRARRPMTDAERAAATARLAASRSIEPTTTGTNGNASPSGHSAPPPPLASATASILDAATDHDNDTTED